MPTGYFTPPKPDRPPELTNVLVGCRNCYTSWFEEILISPDQARLNGPSYIYDKCSECPHTPNRYAALKKLMYEEEQESSHPKPNEALKTLLGTTPEDEKK